MVLFILFNLWKLRLALLWSTNNWKLDTVLCWKGRWQKRCIWLCVWFYVLDSEEEILFIFRMWNRRRLFPNLLFPLCVFVCVGREKNVWYTCCNLSAETDILNLPGFFSVMCANWMSEFCSVKLCFKIFQLDIYILEVLFSVKKMWICSSGIYDSLIKNIWKD